MFTVHWRDCRPGGRGGEQVSGPETDRCLAVAPAADDVGADVVLEPEEEKVNTFNRSVENTAHLCEPRPSYMMLPQPSRKSSEAATPRAL